MKTIAVLLFAMALLLAWNYATCQFCDEGVWPEGGNGTMRQCAIHGENSPITRAYNGISWQVNVYLPGMGCISNSTTPIYIHLGPVKIEINGWFKGFHRVPMINMRYQ
jgi:hypothetical protein